MDTARQAEIFVQHLPAIYKAQPEVGDFLRAFEALLLGAGARLAAEPPGLREIILSLPTYLDPDKTPEAFLPWLASWLALSMRADLAEARKRLLIKRAASLYQWRGTIRGLRELLQIVAGEWVSPNDGVGSPADYTPDRNQPRILEPSLQSLIVGVQAAVGSTTRLGRELPYLFQVVFQLPHPLPPDDEMLALETLIRDTIELGKPAHTYYELKFIDSSGVSVASMLERKVASRAGSHS